MNKRFKHNLSRQFRDRCICMSAWAQKHQVSRELLAQISAGKRVGKRKGQTKEIIELLEKEGFVVQTKKAA